MAKPPFERILSLVERKKLFQKKLISKSSLICKTAQGAILEFLPRSITENFHLDGVLHRKSPVPLARSINVTVLFYSGRDRYFLNSKLLRTTEGWRLLNATEFYKFNRRNSFRVEIPTNLSIQMFVSSVDNIPCRVEARLTEFSSTGARIRWFGNPTLKKSSIIKGHIRWFRNRQIPITAEIKHQTRTGLFGLVFLITDSVQTHRLRLMSVELQQMVNFRESTR